MSPHYCPDDVIDVDRKLFPELEFFFSSLHVKTFDYLIAVGNEMQCLKFTKN